MGWGDKIGNALSAPLRWIGDRNTDDSVAIRPDRPYSPTNPSGQRFTPGYGDFYSSALAASTANNAPARSGLQSQYGSLQNQFGLTGQQFGVQEQGLRNNASFDQQSLGVRQESLGLDRQGIQRLDPILNAREAMARQLREMLDPEWKQRLGEIERTSEYEKFKSTAETRVRGALGSEGYRADQENIRASSSFEADELYRGYQRSVLSANDAISNAWNDVQKNKDNAKQLDLQAKQLGIDSQRLASNLQLGLQRLGLDRTMSLNEILDRMNSNRIDDQMLGNKILQEALAAAPFFQSASFLPPAMQASLTGGR